MTPIHNNRSAHRVEPRRTAGAAGKAAPRRDDHDDKKPGGATSRDRNEVKFDTARERQQAQARALARHSDSNLNDFDKAFEMQEFSAARREKALVRDAVKMDPPRTFKVVAEDARVRTHPMGLVTANVKKGDRFVVEATRTDGKGNTWAWGHAMGDAKKPGWMPMKADKYQVLEKTDEKLPKGYERAGDPMNQAKLWGLKYVRGHEKLKQGKDYTLRFEVKPGNENAKIYENVNAKGRPTGTLQALKPGDVVRIRYTVGDVAVVQRKSEHDKDPHSKWGFVKLDDVRYAPLKEKK